VPNSEAKKDVRLTDPFRNDRFSSAGTHLTEMQPVPGQDGHSGRRDRNEKRREHRIVVDESAVLQVMSPLSHEHLEVRLLDVSKNGLRFFAQVGVLPGSLVMVRIKGHLAFGEARYCVTADEGFFVGIQLSEFIPQLGRSETFGINRMILPAVNTTDRLRSV
jgi:hypothetical protein